MGESQQHARKVLLGLKTLSDYLASCPDVKNSAAARSRIAEQRSQLSNFSSQLGELHSRLPMCDEIMKLDGRWLTHHEYVEMAERITSQAMEAARRVEAGELEITGALRGLRSARARTAYCVWYVPRDDPQHPCHVRRAHVFAGAGSAHRPTELS